MDGRSSMSEPFLFAISSPSLSPFAPLADLSPTLETIEADIKTLESEIFNLSKTVTT